MKRILLLTLIVCAMIDTKAQQTPFENAHQAVHNMSIGWNLGNTLESCNYKQDSLIEKTTDCSVKAYETAWGQPQATRELMHKMATAGFKTIRVPVTWYPHLDKDNHIDQEWMDRVEEVVNYVLDEGMYCVLNVHHDAGDAKSCWLRADLERFDEINSRFVSLWQQIATRFNEYGERLVFEGWGEIIDKYDAWTCPKDPTAIEAANKLAQSFVNTVRATGGNNVQRNLMICTYSASVGGWYAHDGKYSQSDKALAEFKLPKDNVEDHLIASVHCYIPWNWDQNHSKLSEANVAEIKQAFEKFDRFFLSRGIPLVIGEYGALFVDGTYSQEGAITEEDQEEGAKYARLMVEEATKRDISLLYFMGLIDKEDRVKLQWTRPKTVQAIIDAVMATCTQAQSNDIVAEGETPVRVSDSYSFTEGPAADAKGDVFFTDQPNNRIYRWDCESGEITLFTDQSGRSNGMYFDAQGNLIACADMDNQLWSFDMKGHSTILITDYREKLLNGPNDVWISKDGGYYLTDPYFKRDYWTRSPERQQPVEGLYYLAPGGKQLTMLDSTLNQPNGLVGTPDGKHLFVAEAKANRILKYDIQPDGNLTNRQVFADMGSDGMTIDDRGNIYLTGDGVTVFDKDGHKIAHFPIPEDWTANVCFGGKERNILFITASKSVYTLKMLVHGGKVMK